jgi:hypothetical protein
MSANQVRSSSPTRKPGSVENEHETFRIYKYQKPFSAGADKVQTTGRKIPGNDYVMGEICQMEYPFFFIQEGIARTRGKYDK